MFLRTKAIAKKEVKQLSRDKRLLFVMLFFPVFLLGIFGYAVNFDVKNIQLAVYDQDNSEQSRDLLASLSSSNYFNIVKYINNENEINRSLEEKEAQVVVVIPSDFSESINRKEKNIKIQYLIDGVDGNSATIIYNYVEAATLSFNAEVQQEFLMKAGIEPKNPINLETQFWYNPSLETTKYLIPGLIAMILIIASVVSVSLSLVREKERGTIEQINVSSLNTLELLIGKSLPYIFIALLDAIFILIAGYILFDIVIKGSYLLLFFTTLIFIMSSTSLGIFVSVIADNQQVAFSISTFISLLPSVVLSGFIFPIESMPFAVQIFTNITPAKFFIIALRGIVLKGVGLPAFYDQIIYMVLFGLFFLILATIINKKKTGYKVAGA